MKHPACLRPVPLSRPPYSLAAFTRQSRRRRLRLGLGLLTLALLLGLAAPAHAQSQIVKIEEDWVVTISSPDAATDAPQIVTVISPDGTLGGLHAVFELNHATLPAYHAGGMQLQTWHGDAFLSYGNLPNLNLLDYDNEVVSYTSAMRLAGGNLQFEIINGNSTTWGKFGGQGYLKFNHATTMSDLGSYSATQAAKLSRVGFSSHRVDRFVLKEVRYYTADGLDSVDTTERVVHQRVPE